MLALAEAIRLCMQWLQTKPEQTGAGAVVIRIRKEEHLDGHFGISHNLASLVLQPGEENAIWQHLSSRQSFNSTDTLCFLNTLCGVCEVLMRHSVIRITNSCNISYKTIVHLYKFLWSLLNSKPGHIFFFFPLITVLFHNRPWQLRGLITTPPPPSRGKKITRLRWRPWFKS